jgi:choline dehydrogenase-like flavoprotein
MLRRWFASTVSALVHSFAGDFPEGKIQAGITANDAVRFVLARHAGMPDFLRLPIAALTLVFDLSGIFWGRRLFHRQRPLMRLAQVRAWRDSPLGPTRTLIRFYESLVVLAVAEPFTPPQVHLPPRTHGANRREIAVIGSGPGGAVTAALLAEAGRQVTIIEEGTDWPADVCPSFSVAEMALKYRNGGLTPALGPTPVAYAEGCCVGGGSEINSGLYHRTPAEALAIWARDYQTEAMRPEDLAPHFEACERDLSVGLLPGGHEPAASLKLHVGAETLGWRSLEIPRWFSYDGTKNADGTPRGQRQSMSRTYVPRARAAGADLLTSTRAVRLTRDSAHWRVHGHQDGRPWDIEAEHVFICGGATQTPLLLRRSGLGRHVGENFQLHPTVKIVAEFPDAVNSAAMGVPVHQVKEFAERYSFGCSISSPAFVELALLDQPQQRPRLAEAWPRMAVYYAMIIPEGRGSVRPLPGCRDPLVRFGLTPGDLATLAEALQKLGEVLFAAGAVALYPTVRGLPVARTPADLAAWPQRFAAGQANLMTIHLFSSCAMGENLDRCAVDSFGNLHGVEGIHVADASLLCTAPGVNPQGSIMGIARRNALHFLGKS